MKTLTEVTLLKVRAGRPKHVRQKDGTEKIIPPPYVYKAAWMGLRDGVRRRLTETIGPVRTTRHKDAQLYVANKRDAINGGRISGDRLGRIGLARFLANDLEVAALDLKASSLRDLKVAHKHALKALGEDFNVQAIGAAEVAQIRHYLQVKPQTNEAFE